MTKPSYRHPEGSAEDRTGGLAPTQLVKSLATQNLGFSLSESSLLSTYLVHIGRDEDVVVVQGSVLLRPLPHSLHTNVGLQFLGEPELGTHLNRHDRGH